MMYNNGSRNSMQMSRERLLRKRENELKVKKETRSVNISLRTLLNIILNNCIIHQINVAAKTKVSKCYLKKLLDSTNY